MASGRTGKQEKRKVRFKWWFLPAAFVAGILLITLISCSNRRGSGEGKTTDSAEKQTETTSEAGKSSEAQKVSETVTEKDVMVAFSNTLNRVIAMQQGRIEFEKENNGGDNGLSAVIVKEALKYGVSYEVKEITDSDSKIVIEAPDLATGMKTSAEELAKSSGDSFTEAELLNALLAKIRGGSLPKVKTEVTVAIVSENGEKNCELSAELVNAMLGGLVDYYREIQEGASK